MFVTQLQVKADSEPLSGTPINLPIDTSFEGRYTFSASCISPSEHQEGVFTSLSQPITAVSFVRQDSIADPASQVVAVVSYGPIISGELVVSNTTTLRGHTQAFVVEEVYSQTLPIEWRNDNSLSWGLRIAFINEGEFPATVDGFTMVLYS